jgi:ABC-type nitrate/sulfonate/bicarbonate transport system substrate-binding protein
MPTSRRAVVTGLIASVALALLVTACGGGDDDGDTDRVVFMAGFRAQANLPFVAVYVADAKGFFEDEGIDIEIRHSGSGEHLQLLLANEIDFTTGTAAQVLRRREEDLPVRAIALFGQRGDQGFIVRADSGIESPSDFAGRTVGFKAGVVPPELRALLSSVGLTEEDVDLQAVGFDPRIFMEGQVDVFPVFLDNEPDTVRRAGLDIRVFDPHDYGVATLGLTFLTHQDTVTGDPELVERFLRAALRGAIYAESHVDEAIDIVLTFAEDADPDHQRFLLETDLQNAQRPDGLGRGTLEQWAALQDVLIEFDVIESSVDIQTAFNGSFVDQLYDSGDLD